MEIEIITRFPFFSIAVKNLFLDLLILFYEKKSSVIFNYGKIRR